MATIRGTISAVTFKNEDTGFAVLRLKSPDTTVDIPCVGVMPTVESGETVLLTGAWEQHRRFGRQFSVQSFEIVRPTTKEGILAFLSSGFISNIGATRARGIVDTFGTDTLSVMDQEPDRLLEVPGIGRKTVAKITEAWERQKGVRDLALYLREFGVSINLAYKIYRAYGAQAKEKISRNPYALVEDIWGVGFKRADAIAQKLGFEHSSYKRIRAGLAHLLSEAAGEGHTYLPRNELTQRTAELLEVDEGIVTYSLDHCTGERILVADEDRIYQPLYYRAETRVAEILGERVAARAGPVAHFNPQGFHGWMNQQAQRTGRESDPQQIAACEGALSNGVFVLTGGPGTGKTTTLQVIVSFLREQRIMVTLAAPTGRAAQRLGTVSGYQAKTIHRLLEFRPGGEGYRFGRNRDNPIDTDVVIIDEVSMVDLLLMRSLLEALPNKAAIIFVGDSNQLPSVGAGNVLADLIGSGAIPHVELAKVFRQAAQSTIVLSAHEIIRGEVPRFSNGSTDNCFFLTAEEPDNAVEKVVELVCDRLPRRYALDPLADIQVLSPMHRGTLGTQNLNAILQKRLNTHPKTMVRGSTTYSVGDKVMQVRNNYDLGVFNGDIGFVRDIRDEETVVVSYEGNAVEYRLRDLDELVHAYCISIHKSQGCEFKAVVIPLVTQHYIMLQRNLLYTALTRARELCVFVGAPKALWIAVHNSEAFHRYSRLGERIAVVQRDRG